MTNIRDLSGLRFGKLSILRLDQVKPLLGSYFICECDCGVVKSIRGSSLSQGKSNSCGCESAKQLLKRTTHGSSGSNQINGSKRTPEYTSWAKMKGRCLNMDNDNYHHYGGRGIIVCERWMVFENFLQDMGNRPKGTSLERLNVNGNYEKSNCTWASRWEQSNNRRDTVRITINGITKSRGQWCLETGINVATVRGRVKRGWSPEDLFKPLKCTHRVS